ncbi:hypothetical protein SODALDRAFT_327914 [Sodiomyces alkalinus F11]|uniref:Transmembrane protein n=1 Tax=Sodiomyces alkalinus (strain CBS 110278 / VKM F-3762 / F11) TaxID=1314773 RepID=A0A3N2QAL5_SODAK|nr:hypothetical protein SODALDRAFT_327914 [Sodiomyces alkalinus F11]ROT43708.1 hypothetical protein SODALDRAFT_327914 [Sodiomyces alkalinus F11]
MSGGSERRRQGTIPSQYLFPALFACSVVSVVSVVSLIPPGFRWASADKGNEGRRRFAPTAETRCKRHQHLSPSVSLRPQRPASKVEREEE